MATTPDQHYGQIYTLSVTQLAQQKDGRFEPAVRVEMQDAEYKFYNQIGAVGHTTIDSRNKATVINAVPHYRRRVGLATEAITIALDRVDSLKILGNPTSSYVESAASEVNRIKDDVVIAAADGTAYTDKTGATSTSYDATMTCSGTGSDGMTVAKLRCAKKKLDEQEVEKSDRFMAMSSYQMDELLGTTQVTSSDYNTVKALVNGEVDTFLGFKFIASERLGTSGSSRKCLYWQKQGLLLAIGKDNLGPDTIIGRRADLNNLQQVQTIIHAGATRMEEKRVGMVTCVEA